MKCTKWLEARNQGELNALIEQHSKALRVRVVGEWDEVRINRRKLHSLDLTDALIHRTVYAEGAMMYGELRAERVVIRGYLLLSCTRIGGSITLAGARISASLFADNVRIGGALDATGARLGGSLTYRYGLIQGGIVMPDVMHGVRGVAIAQCDGYILWRSEDGLYYAGCRGPLTRTEALAHWGKHRHDERARVFRQAIQEASR